MACTHFNTVDPCTREALFNDFSPNLLLTPLKSSSRYTHSERLGLTSKIFVWGSITWTLIIEKKCAKLARLLSTHACKSLRQVVGAQSRKFCSLHLTIPNEDFGRPNRHDGMRFPGRTFQGRLDLGYESLKSASLDSGKRIPSCWFGLPKSSFTMGGSFQRFVCDRRFMNQ